MDVKFERQEDGKLRREVHWKRRTPIDTFSLARTTRTMLNQVPSKTWWNLRGQRRFLVTKGSIGKTWGEEYQFSGTTFTQESLLREP